MQTVPLRNRKTALPTSLRVVFAVALSYAASAAGPLYERQIWPNWPHDSPTNRWLNPNDNTCSQQQKESWYASIKSLIGLDIVAASNAGDEVELRRVINDAVRALRHRFRDSKSSGLLGKHNEDYGFARNLAGLWVIWFPGALSSTVITWLAYALTDASIVWPVTATTTMAIAVAAMFGLPAYVRERADRYAESLFGALSISDERDPGEVASQTPRVR